MRRAVRLRQPAVRRSGGDSLVAAVFVAPSIALVAAFVAWPLVVSARLALSSSGPSTGIGRFVGTRHVASVLTSPELRTSLLATARLVALVSPVSVLVGTALAVLAAPNRRGFGVFRVVFASAMATGGVVSAAMFVTLFAPTTGFLRWALHAVGALGPDEMVFVLTHDRWALFAVAGVTAWGSVGIVFLLVTAALRSVPAVLLESASIDGCDSWKGFRFVTLPWMGPTIDVALAVTSVHAVLSFGQVALLTGGGPGGRTNTVAYALYRTSFVDGDRSSGAIYSFVVLLVSLAAGGAALRLRRSVGWGLRILRRGCLGVTKRHKRACRSSAEPNTPNRRPHTHPRVAWVDRTWWRLVVLATAAFLFVLPIYFTFVLAVSPVRLRFAYPPMLVPRAFDTSGFSTALREGEMVRNARNSAVVASLITIGHATTSCLLAYAHTFMRFAGRRFVFWAVVASAAVPFEAVALGNYQTIVALGWLDSYPALIIPFLATGTGTLMLTRAFHKVPTDLVDAARIDGSSHIGVLRRIVIPLALPTLTAVTVLSFLAAWMQYFWPRLVASGGGRRTIPLGVAQLAGGSINSFNVLPAAAIMSMTPVIAFLVICQRRLINGLSSTLEP